MVRQAILSARRHRTAPRSHSQQRQRHRRYDLYQRSCFRHLSDRQGCAIYSALFTRRLLDAVVRSPRRHMASTPNAQLDTTHAPRPHPAHPAVLRRSRRQTHRRRQEARPQRRAHLLRRGHTSRRRRRGRQRARRARHHRRSHRRRYRRRHILRLVPAILRKDEGALKAAKE